MSSAASFGSASTLYTDTDLSAAIIGMVERVQQSVVQVTRGQQGAGAGIIWRENGAILTNYHVVAGAKLVQVLLPDDRLLEAKVVGSNRALDLALLEVPAVGLPAALVDDSSTLRVGELVFAIGHPWGERGNVTMGIVSGLGTVRPSSGPAKASYIRSDVRLAPGNSGGPLVNARGAVVGINAMIFGGDQSVAIPSHVAIEWVAGLPSRRVALDLTLHRVEVPGTLQESTGTRREAGLLVVEHGSPPPRDAMLLVGDVLLDVAGEAVEDVDDLARILGRRQRSDKVQLHFLRGGTLRSLEIEVGALERSL